MTVIEDRVVLASSAYCIAIALWALNSYVYDHFLFAPQLGILVSSSGQGKSTLRKVLNEIVHSPWGSHYATPAMLYHVPETQSVHNIVLRRG